MSEPNVPPPPPAAPAGDSNRTLMLVLSYLGLLALDTATRPAQAA